MTVLDLYQVQLGKQTLWGTAVAGSVRLMDVLDARITPLVNATVFQTRHGTLGPGNQVGLEATGGSGFIEGMLTYEDGCYPLEGLFGEAAPSGAGPYVRAYAAGNADSPRIMTVLYGQDTNVYRLTGGLVTKLVISGASGETDTQLRQRYELLGKSAEGGALAALADRSVNPVMASQVQIYVDAWGGTIGTTLINTTAFSFELSLDIDRRVKRYLGSLAPANHERRRAQPGANTLKLSLEFNATSKAYLDDILAASAVFQRQVRIKATSGTRIYQLDFAGSSLTAPEVFVDNDGTASMDLVLSATENTALADWFKASVTNGVAALP